MVTVSSCKKYPDGPLISLRTKEHRLVGTWDVESYTVDGIDSTTFLKSQSFYGKYKIQDGENGVGEFIYNSNSGTYNSSGHWFFENKKRDVRISHSDPTGLDHIGPYLAKNVIWEIRKLKEKELWLKTIYNGKEHIMKMKK